MSASSPLPPAPSFTDALRTINPLQDLQKLPSVPCARFSLLFGIVAGTSIGTLRFLFSHSGSWSRRVGSLRTKAAPATAQHDRRWQNVGTAANWAVGSWGVASLGAWETCRRRQTAEAARMQALVSEVKARRAAKASSAPSAASTAAGKNNSSSTAQERPIGGVLIGQHGREALQDKQQREETKVGDSRDQKSSKWNW
ncbi:hypothetical protein OIV83_004196 [Microbotryomycetes sp. JL201]|nr:hypothetical protein OIV83_004196 [Microbotryomycetes sp. JL201]